MACLASATWSTAAGGALCGASRGARPFRPASSAVSDSSPLSRPASAEHLQCPFEQQLSGRAALNPAAGGLRQCRRRYKCNRIDRDLVLPGDRVADAAGDLVEIQISALRPLDFLHHRKLLIPFSVEDRERRAAVPAERRMAFLYGPFDILRIVVRAANDDEVLDPPGDEQPAVLVQEPEISGPQPVLLRGVHDARVERVRRGRRIFPIAAGYVRPADPDLAKSARGDAAACVRIDDRDILALNTAATCDQ